MRPSSHKPKIFFDRLKAELETSDGKLVKLSDKEYLVKRNYGTNYPEYKEIEFNVKLVVNENYPFEPPCVVTFPALATWQKQGQASNSGIKVRKDKKKPEEDPLVKEQKKAQRKIAKHAMDELGMTRSGNLDAKESFMKSLKSQWNPATCSLLSISNV